MPKGNAEVKRILKHCCRAMRNITRLTARERRPVVGEGGHGDVDLFLFLVVVFFVFESNCRKGYDGQGTLRLV